ncbi:MAG: hypothetical protein A2X71_01415 [Thiobacillus sp. GWE1_62_9]|nr:MAG: hypothetical protein A2X71_01415 [Thiobacillus sp. GWE1_62_9]HBU29181.1 hypothetical protein [Thiobacillus sp.]
MEFFRTLHQPRLDVPALKALLAIHNLPALCASISTATPGDGDAGDIYCLWGGFSLRRDELRNGVRYALLDCPHALAWTVTLDEMREHVVIHCTIDKTHPDPEFAESIETFVSDWSDGISKVLAE